ncbi:hypothetical protein [Kitasatospora sp. DSM 101779]|uniref:hypothetical protein n=1 Tax=Kitasatospora sp. DSM 101779 TaxID=2853165 RepID=UPI0021D9CAE7|nr:hypothetical protein [Kitasatospora sp. DSM 101779]MCU7821150.1 hypothetical protein [Kitasatospora sp. DSM 101779]
MHADPEEGIAKPRFREGLYPVEEVTHRLRSFVEPASYPEWRELLRGRNILFLVGEARTGTSTTGLALLNEVTRGKRITGLDPEVDLAEWTPSNACGYLVQGLKPGAGALLDEVALNRITECLVVADAHLLVIIDRTAGISRALSSWCRTYVPPDPFKVARRRLERMAEDNALTPEQLATASASLGDAPFKDYLTTTHSPTAGVEVAEELWEVVANGRTHEAAADNLRLGSTEAAAELLAAVRGSVDELALATTIALLEGQDRTVVERFAASLRNELSIRVAADAAPREFDLLGRGIKDRLDSVQARLLPREVSTSGSYRYWTQPVAFRGKHLAEEVLERLWLDYEGFSDVLMDWLVRQPREPGIERVAGKRIGQVICQASGPAVLRQLGKFAASKLHWQRRLVSFALGETVQDVVLSGAVRAQLRKWSIQTAAEPRCTVAETCAGSLGLALPAFALNLLDNVLEASATPLDDQVRTSVAAALGVLLTEHANREMVFKHITAWLGEPNGTARHAFAAHAVEALCRGGFPTSIRAGVRRLTLNDLFGEDWAVLVPLTLRALEDETLHGAVRAALTAVERSGPDGQERVTAFVTALIDSSGGHPGLRGLLLAMYRSRLPAGTEAAPQ